MATQSFYQKLTSPLSPRTETWVRRVFGFGQAVLAVLAGIQLIELTAILSRAREIAGVQPVDPHGFGAAALQFLLVPSTVLFSFGAVAVWRKWSVPPLLPLGTIAALELVVRALT